MSNSLWSHILQHARLPCPSLSPGVYSNSCPFELMMPSNCLIPVTPFSSCPQSFPASGSFLIHPTMQMTGRMWQYDEEGRLLVTEGVNIRLAHQLPGKPADRHTSLIHYHSRNSSGVKIRTITSWSLGQVCKLLPVRFCD